MALSECRVLLLCLSLLFLLVEGNSSGAAAATGDGGQPVVFLTVSSLASESKSQTDRMLELNWEGVPLDTGAAAIQLRDKDPLLDSGAPLESVDPTEEGYYRTSVRFPEQHFSPNNLTDACLGFWIAYVEGGRVAAASCLRARPHWMQRARHVIGNVSLVDLMVPGTHNAGSYARFDSRDDTLINRYLLTQEEDVWHQLVYGIRYLDLRVAHGRVAGSPERFWITHSTFLTDVSVRDVARQVKQFMQATNEIVVMDFHRFVTGFHGRRALRRHRELISMLEQELGDHMIPVGLTPFAPLEEFWSANRTLLVGYADSTARRYSRHLFPAIKHLWGDVDSVEDLHAYLNRTLCRQRAKRLTSAMAQLTPTTAGAIFNVYGGLRDMADSVNRQATRWFRDDWRGCVNIVATDFFLGNNMIEVAIEMNKNLYQ